MIRLLAAIIMLMAPAAACAADIPVATPSQLQAAISKAKGGDTIQLAAGDYGTLVIRDTQFASTVTIESADPAHRARFTNMVLYSPKNLAFSRIEVSYMPKPGEPTYLYMVRVNGGANIAFDDIFVHGVIDGDVTTDMNGLVAIDVDGMTVSNSRFLEVNAGIKFQRVRNGSIRSNDIGMIGSDAIEIPAADNVVISWNTMHDFRTVGAVHPDGIQCWTTGEVTACKNVKIIGNQLIGTANPNSPYIYPQGIWFGDELQLGGYANIEITGNLFRCVNWQAIAMYATQARGTVVRFNRIEACPGVTPWIKITDPGAVVEGNVAPMYLINTAKAALPAGNYTVGLLGK